MNRPGKRSLCLGLWAVLAACAVLAAALLGGAMEEQLDRSAYTDGPPRVMSRDSLSLLEGFLPPEQAQRLESAYISLSPESSEAGRIAGDYPMARQVSTVLLRGDSDSPAALGDLYCRAARGLLIYLRMAQGSGELEQAELAVSARAPAEDEEPEEFGSNLRDFSAQEESELPEGVLGIIPEGALFTMPGEQTSSAEESREQAAPEDEEETSQRPTPLREHRPLGGLDLSQAALGFGSARAEQFAVLLPLLPVTQGSVEKAVQLAATETISVCRGTGRALERLLLREMGVQPQQGKAWLFPLLLSLVVVIGACCAAGAVFLGEGEKLPIGSFGAFLSLGGLILAFCLRPKIGLAAVPVCLLLAAAGLCCDRGIGGQAEEILRKGEPLLPLLFGGSWVLLLVFGKKAVAAGTLGTGGLFALLLTAGEISAAVVAAAFAVGKTHDEVPTAQWTGEEKSFALLVAGLGACAGALAMLSLRVMAGEMNALLAGENAGRKLAWGLCCGLAALAAWAAAGQGAENTLGQLPEALRGNLPREGAAVGAAVGAVGICFSIGRISGALCLGGALLMLAFCAFVPEKWKQYWPAAGWLLWGTMTAAGGLSGIAKLKMGYMNPGWLACTLLVIPGCLAAAKALGEQEAALRKNKRSKAEP